MAEKDSDSWEYERIQGYCRTPGAEGAVVYGVRVRFPDGTVYEAPDVDVCPAVVEQLIRRLQKARLAACHLSDVVADFIEEMAAGG